jgi:diacylglycerol kinase
MIGRAKDMAAGATLSASIVAIIVGLYIFSPHIMSLLQGQ